MEEGRGHTYRLLPKDGPPSAGTGGQRRRRLGLCFLAICALLGVYVLCVSLEIRVPWHMVVLARLPGAGYTKEPSRPHVSEEPLEPIHQETPAPPPPPSASTDRRPSSATGTTTSEMQSASTTRPQGESSDRLRPGETASSSGQGEAGITASSSLRPPLSSRPGQTTTTGPALRPLLTSRPGQVTRTTAGPALRPLLTEPPFIGDSYASDNVPPLTDCPDSVHSRVSQTEFGGRFLGQIPVLQWAKHATRDQYERLRQYPGAHGWGGLDFQTLVDSLSVLNMDANRQMFDDWPRKSNGSRCVRCAVVGNGGILKGSKKGREIDQHHYVFRTNGAITQGMEQDVGGRTSLYTFSTNTMRNSMRSYAAEGYGGPPQSEETHYVFLPDHDRDYLLMKAAATHTPVERGPEKSQSPPTYFGRDVTAAKFKMYHPDFVRYLRNRFLRSHALQTRYKDIYRPSTGAVMLLAALHTCDQVSAYGFMTPDYSRYSDHYYDRTFHPVGFFINHDLRLEMDLWQQLHRAGLIDLYMRQ